MNIFHITYEPIYKTLDLHFWKCNLNCRGCYKNYEIYDLGLVDNAIEKMATKSLAQEPERFLPYDEVIRLTEELEIKYAIFMGTEAAIDPELPGLARSLHNRHNSYNILLTNGLKLTDMTDIDEVIFSLKAFSDETHREYTGKSNKKILANFKKIYDTGKKLQAETVLIPEYIDSEEVEELARFVGSIDKDLTFRVIGYFPVPGCSWRAATGEDVEKAAELARKHLNNVTCMTSEMKGDNWKPKRIY